MEAMNSPGQLPVRVQIDLNSRDREGNVRTRLLNATGQVEVGDIVVAYEPEDKVSAVAEIVRVDRKGGFLYLRIDWDTLDEDEPGRLVKFEGLREFFSEEVVQALSEWASSQHFNLSFRGFLAGGRSSVALMQADLETRLGPDRHVIVKIRPEPDVNSELSASRLIEQRSGREFYRAHFPRPVISSKLPGSQSYVQIEEIASTARGRLVPLSRFAQDADFGEYCAAILSSIGKEWNSGAGSIGIMKMPVRDYIYPRLGDRVGRLESSLEAAGLNPGAEYWDGGAFGRSSFVLNPSVTLQGRLGDRYIKCLIGSAHGDLRAENILVPQDDDGDLRVDNFVLIDFAQFSRESSLSRDPMQLLLSAVDAWLPGVETEPAILAKLADLVVEPHVQSAPSGLRKFAEISMGIHGVSELLLSTGAHLGSVPRQQDLVELVAIALSAATRSNAGSAYRFFHFTVAAVALQSLAQAL